MPRAMVAKFLSDESAATAIEYGLIASLIAGFIITSVNGVGDVLNKNYFMKINTAMK